jgi:hypothetical protein
MASVQGLGLPYGIERSLLAQLGAAQQGGACDNLRAFMNRVRAQSGKKIAADDAADLLDDAAASAEDPHRLVLKVAARRSRAPR